MARGWWRREVDRAIVAAGMADAPPTNLIALRDGKRQAEALISSRYAEGLIDADELERRLELVQDAETMAALERLIVDLVEPGTAPSTALMIPSAPSPSGNQDALARLDDIAPQRQFTALFSSVEQAGRWTPARHNRVVDVFGDATLDLREAELGPGTTIIDVRCVFASLVLIVPPGLAVRIEASATFASVERDEHINEQPRAAGDPVVVIQGIVLFASLEIHDRMPGEGRREARRRHRALRKAAKKQRRAALKRGET
jgi:hypothetical protein